MSLGLMCVLSLNVMVLLSCCGGRLWASLWRSLFVLLRYTGILWRVFACQVSVCYFVANGLRYVGECLVCVMYVCRWL